MTKILNRLNSLVVPYSYYDTGTASGCIGVDGLDSNKLKLSASSSLDVDPTSAYQISIDPGTNGDVEVQPNGTGNLNLLNGDFVVVGGNIDLPSTTSSEGTININSNRFVHAYNNSTFVGTNAGNYTASGLFNTGVGNTVLENHTSADQCTAIGHAALNSCESGDNNTAIGYVSLAKLTTGACNTAVGQGTLEENGGPGGLLTGSFNTVLGDIAGNAYRSSESSNILIGYNVAGTLGESNALRIGVGTGTGNGQINKTFIAGIVGITNGGASTVPYIQTSNGQISTVPGGAVTMNTGTQSLSLSSDASATTVNVGTGAAAKTVTLGSINSSSSLALKYGTSDFTLASATGTVMSALDTGEITYPLQPAFLAYGTANENNVTGDGTNYTLAGFSSEVFDQGGDFASSTFTAPVTGRYFFNSSVLFGGLTGSHDRGFIRFVTSNRNYLTNQLNFGAVRSSPGSGDQTSQVTTTFADMDAGDTCTIEVQVGASSKVVDIVYASATDPRTWFSGHLVC